MAYSSLSCDELVRACAESGNAEVWEEFICRFGQLISRTVMRVARGYGESRIEVFDELVQETYSKFCANDRGLLRNFEPRHQNAFYGLVKKVAANVVHDHFRKPENPGQPFATDFELLEAEASVSDQRTSNDETFNRPILFQEMDAFLSFAFSPRDREIFWLYYQQGFTAVQLAAIPYYDLQIKGVESLLYRMKVYLQENYGEKNQPASK
jgi:RNA polymerase sigma-70 factor (ECF subfamily)